MSTFEEKEDGPAAAAVKTPELIIIPNAPGPQDVISTRNSSVHRHPGNITYTAFVDERRQEYQAAPSRHQKTKLTHTVIQLVESAGGKFVKQVPVNSSDAQHHVWVELTADEKREKVSHALRSQKKPRTTQKTLIKQQKELEHSAALTLVQGFAAETNRAVHSSNDDKDQQHTPSSPAANQKDHRDQDPHEWKNPAITRETSATTQAAYPQPLHHPFLHTIPGALLFPPPEAHLPSGVPVILPQQSFPFAHHDPARTTMIHHPYFPLGLVPGQAAAPTTLPPNAVILSAAPHQQHQHPFLSSYPPNTALGPLSPDLIATLEAAPEARTTKKTTDIPAVNRHREDEHNTGRTEDNHHEPTKDIQPTTNSQHPLRRRSTEKSQLDRKRENGDAHAAQSRHDDRRKSVSNLQKDEAYASILAMGQRYRNFDLLLHQQEHAKKMKSPVKDNSTTPHKRLFETRVTSRESEAPSKSSPRDNARQEPTMDTAAATATARFVPKNVLPHTAPIPQTGTSHPPPPPHGKKRRFSSSLWKNARTRKLPIMSRPPAVSMERSVRRKPSWFHRISPTATHARKEEHTAGVCDYREFLPPLPGAQQDETSETRTERRKEEAQQQQEENKDAPHVNLSEAAKHITDENSGNAISLSKETTVEVTDGRIVQSDATTTASPRAAHSTPTDDADVMMLTKIMDMEPVVPPRRVSKEETIVLHKASTVKQACSSTAKHQQQVNHRRRSSSMSSCSSMSSLGSSASESDYVLARAARKKARKAL